MANSLAGAKGQASITSSVTSTGSLSHDIGHVGFTRYDKSSLGKAPPMMVSCYMSSDFEHMSRSSSQFILPPWASAPDPAF